MMKYFFISFLFFFALIQQTAAQSCTDLGQNPGTAFPVCGTTVFNQGSVSICGNTAVASQCTGTLFTDKNPYWYKHLLGCARLHQIIASHNHHLY